MGNINVKLDPLLHLKIETYMKANEMTSISAAVRTLLNSALREQNEALEVNFKRSSVREGLRHGLSVMREEMERAVHKAVGRLEKEEF